MKKNSFFDKAPDLTFDRGNSAPSLLSSSHTTSTHFNLGMDLTFTDTSAALLATLNAPSITGASNNSLQSSDVNLAGTPKLDPRAVNATLKTLLNDERILNSSSFAREHKWLNSLNTIEKVSDAAIRGKKLSDNIQTSLDSGQSTAEAYTCQTSRTLSEASAEVLIKGAVVGGIPAYLAACVDVPPLAASIPVITPLIPKAYSGAGKTAVLFGKTVESACHDIFDAARQLSAGQKK